MIVFSALTTKLCHTPINIKLYFHANVILTHREAFVNRDEGNFTHSYAFSAFCVTESALLFFCGKVKIRQMK